MTHIPVLLKESIEGLAIKDGDIFVDGTVGNGGHTENVCKNYGSKVKVIAIDMDSDAITRSKERITGLDCNATFVQGNFGNISAILEKEGLEKADRILLDIGLSSNQLEESGRGFSFRKDEPLLMTFGKEIEGTVTAMDIVNSWAEEELAEILKNYGEESFSGRIARAIVEARKEKMIGTSGELAEVVWQAVPGFYRKKKIHPATKTFQAIRIAVNRELEMLEKGLGDGFQRLASGGRMAVISFHSLEDRIAKNFFKEKAKNGEGILINKKPIIPSREEIKINPRSRSSKLRIIEKLK